MSMLMVFVGLLVSGAITLIVYSAYIIAIGFTIWMAVDAAKQDRFWWVVLIIGVPIIGSAAYYYTEKKHEYAKAPVHHIHVSETEQEHEVTPKKLVHKKKEKEEVKEMVALKDGEVDLMSENNEEVKIHEKNT